jgi:hypothetical protein
MGCRGSQWEEFDPTAIQPHSPYCFDAIRLAAMKEQAFPHNPLDSSWGSAEVWYAETAVSAASWMQDETYSPPGSLPVMPETLDGWLSSGDVPSFHQIGMTGEYRRHEHGAHAGRIDHDADMRDWMTRKAVIRTHGFAIPCREALEAICSLSPILEVGAGSGYWTALIRKLGCDAIASDVVSRGWKVPHGRFAECLPLDGAAAVKEYSDRNVLMIWPAAHGDWMVRSLQAMHTGQRLALISESSCGNPEFYNYLKEVFEVEIRFPVPRWPGSGDYGLVAVRR